MKTNEEKMFIQNEIIMQPKEYTDVVKKIMKFVKDNHAFLSAVIVSFVSGCFWGVKGLWYSYNSGYFSIYKIDKDYIDMNYDNFILQILSYVVIGGSFILVNWLYYKMLSKKCKVLTMLKKILYFYVIEGMTAVIGFLIVSTDITVEYIWELVLSGEFYVLLIAIFIFCVFFNLLGAYMLIDSKISKKRRKEQEEISIKECISKIIKFLVLFIITEFVLFYIYGVCDARTKVDYKVIIEEKQDNEKSKYIFSVDGYNVEMYPIVYENEEIYVLSKLYKLDDKVKIDFNYQKIVEKDTQETYYVRNINYIKYDK